MLCALVHSLIALSVACQQSLALNRVSAHPQGLQLAFVVISGRIPLPSDSTADDREPCVMQAFTWQIPTMLLGTSIAFVLVGLSIAVYDNAQKVGGMGPEG